MSTLGFDVQYFLQDFVAQSGESYEDLYKMAQQPGRVLPRLYLMVTTACCAIRADPKQVSYYLNDLLEVCKGIQNPMRGLFLRSFLSSSVRALLPDTSSTIQNPC
jgi:vacuolar protein sorting-associated protein 35